MPLKPHLNVWTKEALEKKAVDELGESPKRLKEDIETLRTWIAKSPHLHNNVKEDDEFLTMFLRGCKFSLERTKEKIDMHFTIRGNLPSWFDNWNPLDPNIQAILKTGTYLPLRGYDKHGRFVLLQRLGASDPSATKIEDGFKTSTMLMELAGRGDVQANICGVAMILDFAGSNAQHALQMTPALAKTMLTVYQEGYPARPKVQHFLNLPGFMTAVFQMVNSLQKDKMKQRSMLHPKGDYSALHESVGKDVLPEEYGGTNGTVAELTDYWVKTMEANKEWLMEQSKYKSDESKRPGKPKAHADIFGIEGSFRKLEID